MDYIETRFTLTPNEEYLKDVLSAELATIGFESFVQTDEGLTAYCSAENYDDNQLKDLLGNFPLEAKIRFENVLVKEQNWNEEWEKYYFEPVVIGGECVIRSSFHKDVPQAKYNILIDPRMSFGTGHHETTSLMLEYLLQIDNMQGKSFLDMGCGTAVLSILAAMKDAGHVLGIDNDEWAYRNALDNLALNAEESGAVTIQRGSAELLDGMTFDFIFANINRNVLLKDMPAYVKCFTDYTDGELYLSGFYREDIPVIEQKANELGLHLVSVLEKNNWVAVKMVNG